MTPMYPLREFSKAQIDDFAKVSMRIESRSIKFMALYLSGIECGVGISDSFYDKVDRFCDRPAMMIELYPEIFRYYKKRIRYSKLSEKEKYRLSTEAEVGYHVTLKKTITVERRRSLQSV